MFAGHYPLCSQVIIYYVLRVYCIRYTWNWGGSWLYVELYLPTWYRDDVEYQVGRLGNVYTWYFSPTR